VTNPHRLMVVWRHNAQANIPPPESLTDLQVHGTRHNHVTAFLGQTSEHVPAKETNASSRGTKGMPCACIFIIGAPEKRLKKGQRGGRIRARRRQRNPAWRSAFPKSILWRERDPVRNPDGTKAPNPTVSTSSIYHTQMSSSQFQLQSLIQTARYPQQARLFRSDGGIMVTRGR